jgi:hypothetical protein
MIQEECAVYANLIGWIYLGDYGVRQYAEKQEALCEDDDWAEASRYNMT